ncbi:unnamed protein product, partial [Darwinula stevensoni]
MEERVDFNFHSIDGIASAQKESISPELHEGGEDYWHAKGNYPNVFEEQDGATEGYQVSGARTVTSFQPERITSNLLLPSPNAEKSKYLKKNDPAISQISQQISFLKKKTEMSYSSLLPDDMLKRMFLGQPHQVEVYKKMSDKVSLLSGAIKSGDGNAVLAALLHLRKTLKKSLFQKLLLEQVVAADHYIEYLKIRYEHQELLDLLAVLDRVEEAAMLKFSLAMSKVDPESRLKALQNAHRTHFLGNPVLSQEASSVLEEIRLLEQQMPIASFDSARNLSKEKEQGNGLQDQKSVIGSSLLGTICYCVEHHWKMRENHLASPLNVKKTFALKERQFLWPALHGLAKSSLWPEIESLLLAKGFLRRPHLKMPVTLEYLLDILERNGGPERAMALYIQAAGMEPDVTARLAAQYKCSQYLSSNHDFGIIICDMAPQLSIEATEALNTSFRDRPCLPTGPSGIGCIRGQDWVGGTSGRKVCRVCGLEERLQELSGRLINVEEEIKGIRKEVREMPRDDLMARLVRVDEALREFPSLSDSSGRGTLSPFDSVRSAGSQVSDNWAQVVKGTKARRSQETGWTRSPCIDSILLLEEGFELVSVDASDKMLKYALKTRWNRRKEPAFDQWG